MDWLQLIQPAVPSWAQFPVFICKSHNLNDWGLTALKNKFWAMEKGATQAWKTIDLGIFGGDLQQD